MMSTSPQSLITQNKDIHCTAVFPIISMHPYKMDIYGCGCKDELQTSNQDTNRDQQEGLSPFKERFYTL